jgi:hypothetical protein
MHTPEPGDLHGVQELPRVQALFERRRFVFRVPEVIALEHPRTPDGVSQDLAS